MTGLFHQPEPYSGQKYSDLKDECKSSGQLFKDPLFPANYSSLFRGGAQKIANVVWKRPGVGSFFIIFLIILI